MNCVIVMLSSCFHWLVVWAHITTFCILPGFVQCQPPKQQATNIQHKQRTLSYFSGLICFSCAVTNRENTWLSYLNCDWSQLVSSARVQFCYGFLGLQISVAMSSCRGTFISDIENKSNILNHVGTKTKTGVLRGSLADSNATRWAIERVEQVRNSRDCREETAHCFLPFISSQVRSRKIDVKEMSNGITWFVYRMTISSIVP